MADKLKDIKAVRIKFFDNDFNSAALGAAKALAMVLDVTTAPEEFILSEFKFLIHRLANIHRRSGDSGYAEIESEYFDECTIELLTYVPKGWDNSETVIYDIEEGRLTLL